jgi:hypothetical protein
MNRSPRTPLASLAVTGSRALSALRVGPAVRRVAVLGAIVAGLTSAAAPAYATSTAAPAAPAAASVAARPALADDNTIEVTAHPVQQAQGPDLPDIVCRIHVSTPVLSEFRSVLAGADVHCDHPVRSIALIGVLYRSGLNISEDRDSPFGEADAHTSVAGGRCGQTTYDNWGSATIEWPFGYPPPATSNLHDVKTSTFNAIGCPPTVGVPGLYGLTASGARNAVVAAGLTPKQGTISDPSCSSEAVVGFQSPAPGTQVERGTTVTFSIWRWPSRCPVNDL